MGSLRTYVTFIMASPYATLSHFVNSTLSPPMWYSLNFTKKLQNEKKEDFLYMWQLQRIVLCQGR